MRVAVERDESDGSPTRREEMRGWGNKMAGDTEGRAEANDDIIRSEDEELEEAGVVVVGAQRGAVV